MATNTQGNVKVQSIPLSTPRRKSLHVQVVAPDLFENNDESERLNIRNEITTAAIPTEATSFSDRRKSLGLSFLTKVSVPEIQERITECIKLNAENKINAKNAFCLKMIDLMTYMIKKDDANMCNLQVASASLDVSAKIYSYRVDSVHNEVIKIASGLDKNDDESTVDDMNPENNVSESQENEKKKKKRNKQRIFGTVDSLRGTIETAKPSLHIMENEDTATTDSLYQVMLPNHAHSKYYFHFCKDVILDTIENKIESENPEVAVPKVKNCSELEICPVLVNFEFLRCPEDDDEIEKDNDGQSNMNNTNELRFDLDASLPPDDEICNDVSYVNTQDNAENADVLVEVQRPVKQIMDLREVVSINIAAPSDYSFIPSNSHLHWAGPSHWRPRNLMRIKGSRIEEACQQEPVRRRKEIEVCYDIDEQTEQTIAPKFAKSKSITLNPTISKWEEETLTLPPDMCYDITSATKLYLHELITIRQREKDDLNVTHVSDLVTDYDYNNENDTSYCPNVPNDDYQENNEADNRNECNAGGKDVGTQELLAFTGENLVAVPKSTNKIAVPYSTRAKKVDMQQLKKTMYKILINSSNDNENINTENTQGQEKDDQIEGNMSMRKVYEALPKMLSTSNAESLSLPIAFVSLLHIANERNLELESNEEMSDIIIKKIK